MIETWPPEHVGEAPSIPRGNFLSFLSQRFSQYLREFSAGTWRERVLYIKEKTRLLTTVAREQQLPASSAAERLLSKVSHANYQAIKHYVPQPYNGPLLLILAGARAVNPGNDPRLLWGNLASGNCSICQIDATDSGWILKEPHVQRLAEMLKQHLRLEDSLPRAVTA